MAARRLSMRIITEVLRLHHDHGLSARQIAKSLSIAEARSGITWVEGVLRHQETEGERDSRRSPIEGICFLKPTSQCFAKYTRF